MKRIWFSVIMVLIGIIIINGCRRIPAPTAPAPTNTAVSTNTPVNIKTWTQTNTPFASATDTTSKTPARTVTMTNTCDCLTGTQTPTSTLTPAPQGYLTWNCAPVSTPIGIAVDNNNNGVYVTEIFCPSLGIVVQEYDFNGNTITQWGSIGSGNGQFSVSMYGGPGIAVDNTGAYIYVADSGNNRVQKFDSNGNYINQWGTSGNGNGQFNGPNWVAIDNTGSIYVSDAGNNRIQKFDSNENYINQWGTSGSGNGQFNFYIGGGTGGGIAVDNTRAVIYVADTTNNRIQKFDLSGNYILQWGSQGTGNSQFYYPCGIAVNNVGYVFVNDTFDSRIEEFDSSGNYIAQWGNTAPWMGNGVMQFFDPEGIAINNAGSVFVADSGNARIQRFAP